MNVIFYKNFSKKENSTKIPTEQGKEISLYLKKDTSIESPTFIIDRLADEMDLDYTYCRLLNHYYFINDITLGNNAFYEISCTMDTYASHRDDILNTTAYIKYAADSTNILLRDSRLSQAVEQRVRRSEVYTPIFDLTDSPIGGTGIYILTTTGNANSGISFCNNYILVERQVQVLANYLWNLDTDIKDDMARQYGDVMGCIINLKYMPINPAGYIDPTTADDIVIANQISPAKGFLYNGRFDNTVINIPIYEEGDYTDFRSIEPYTAYKLYLPYYGLIEISASDLIGFNKLRVKISIDINSMKLSYMIHAINADMTVSNPLGIYTTTIGYMIPVSTYQGQAAQMIQNGASSLVSIGANIATGNILGVATTTLNALINTGADMFKRTAQVSGAPGGDTMQSFEHKIYLIKEIRPTLIEPEEVAETQGRPYEQVDRIGNHTGYVQTVNASVDGNMLAGDRNAINAGLDSGIFIE